MDGEQPTNVRGRRYDDIRLQEGWRGGEGCYLDFITSSNLEERRKGRDEELLLHVCFAVESCFRISGDIEGEKLEQCPCHERHPCTTPDACKYTYLFVYYNMYISGTSALVINLNRSPRRTRNILRFVKARVI